MASGAKNVVWAWVALARTEVAEVKCCCSRCERVWPGTGVEVSGVGLEVVGLGFSFEVKEVGLGFLFEVEE